MQDSLLNGGGDEINLFKVETLCLSNNNISITNKYIYMY